MWFIRRFTSKNDVGDEMFSWNPGVRARHSIFPTSESADLTIPKWISAEIRVFMYRKFVTKQFVRVFVLLYVYQLSITKNRNMAIEFK